MLGLELRELVGSPSLETFKPWLEETEQPDLALMSSGAWSQAVCPVCMERDWELRGAAAAVSHLLLALDGAEGIKAEDGKGGRAVLCCLRLAGISGGLFSEVVR